MRDARAFDAGVYRPAPEDVILAGREPEVLRGARISANVLDILGVRPIAGRGFRVDEDGAAAPPVALISERLWTVRFAKAPSVVGTPVTLHSTPVTIVGVLPATFQFPLRGVDVWLPRPAAAAFVAPQFQACCAPLMGIARLRSGVTRRDAAAELAVLNARYEDGTRRVDAGPAALTPLKDDLVGRVDAMLWMLMAAVAFVLVIACANVATLLMARATSRAREFAVRTALGAARWRIVQQLITESLVLTLLGGALGLALARAGAGAVATMRLFDLPRASEIAIDGPVLGVTMAVACASAVLFGTFPSLQLLGPTLMDRLRQSGAMPESPRRARFGVGTRGALTIAQVALSLILLIGAALMIQTIGRLSRVDLGFPTAGLLTMRVPLPVSTYDTADKRAAFFEQLAQRVNAMPGVRSATVARAMPTTGGLATNFQIEGDRIPDPGHIGQQVNTVTPGYFEAIGLMVKRGRALQPRDNTASAPPVAIVNERFARKFWPSYPSGMAPLGARLFVPVITTTPLEIVGVVGDVRHGGPAQREPDPQIYVSDRLYPPQNAFLALRVDGDLGRAIAAVRAEVRAIDPMQPITDVNMMDDLLERSTGQQHLAARVLGLFAATALTLALIGLYGVLSYSVTQRTHEIGIRRALGAGHAEVVWMVLGPSLRVTMIGIALGVAGAYVWTTVLTSLLFDVSTTDRSTFVGVPIAFICVATIASLVPAWRASRLDPNVVLRAE